VTPRLWQNGENWVEEKKKEGTSKKSEINTVIEGIVKKQLFFLLILKQE
jgi:hypothetical protein